MSGFPFTGEPKSSKEIHTTYAIFGFFVSTEPTAIVVYFNTVEAEPPSHTVPTNATVKQVYIELDPINPYHATVHTY